MESGDDDDDQGDESEQDIESDESSNQDPDETEGLDENDGLIESEFWDEKDLQESPCEESDIISSHENSHNGCDFNDTEENKIEVDLDMTMGDTSQIEEFSIEEKHDMINKINSSNTF